MKKGQFPESYGSQWRGRRGRVFTMFKSAFAQECLEETRVSNSSTDSISAAMLPRERHKLYKSQVKTETEDRQSAIRVEFYVHG